MKLVSEIFNQGPEAVTHWFAGAAGDRDIEPMNVKELADICWTRASTLAKTQAREAARRAKAALVGYEFLAHSSEPLIAESASENVAALRSWKILAN